MRIKTGLGFTIFQVVNTILLIMAGLLCIIPFVHVIALSFSGSTASMSGRVLLWPIDFTTRSYEYVTRTIAFVRSMLISFERVLLALPLSMFITILSAYPLSKEPLNFKWRSFYVWFFLITILFSGGLIPWYMVINKMGLINNIWALILPTAVPVFNIIILLNFFRGLPNELEEAALLDGAGHWVTLWKIFVPLSKPALATLTLFVMVSHWNSWFDGLILMNSPEKYPLQSYLQTLIVTRNLTNISRGDLDLLKFVNERTSRAAQIILASLPILLVYPYLQRFFTKGIVLGSVKG